MTMKMGSVTSVDAQAATSANYASDEAVRQCCQHMTPMEKMKCCEIMQAMIACPCDTCDPSCTGTCECCQDCCEGPSNGD